MCMCVGACMNVFNDPDDRVRKRKWPPIHGHMCMQTICNNCQND